MGGNDDITYSGSSLRYLAFPLGGIAAGMMCLEGNGGINHVSLRNRPELYHEPGLFASISVAAEQGGAARAAKILEGPLPAWKIYGPGEDRGNGIRGRPYGFPRFKEARFTARFPFGTVELADDAFPLRASCTGWSPFIPGDADRSGLPVAALEYTLESRDGAAHEFVFGYHVPSFIGSAEAPASIEPLPGGVYFAAPDGQLAVRVEGAEAVVDHCWFRGAWFDPGSMLWDQIRTGTVSSKAPPAAGESPSPGATIWIRGQLPKGKPVTLRVLFAWHFAATSLVAGEPSHGQACGPDGCSCSTDASYRPYYSTRFADARAVMERFRADYAALRAESLRFADCFFSMSVPRELLEAVAANLSILKSPTILRGSDGRLWGWEGCFDGAGCCYGSCTHVWNYAQAIPHLFPELERTLREAELNCSQDSSGHQNFRTTLPISVAVKRQIAAADGQLGGIIKVYREWRICADEQWLRRVWPAVKRSMDFAIRHWDPSERGVLLEAHHNTYDIEFWGADGMCSSIYLGALTAFSLMGEALGEDVARYRELVGRGRRYLEERLFNGEYFVQELEYRALRTPYDASKESSPEARERGAKEGPKYQYTTGCLSDGIIGAWFGECAGLPEFIDPSKVQSHLKSVFRYNFRESFLDHGNPQRAGYAMHDEGGLLLCSWPHGGQPSLPFVYSHEVWTGIEYQVAAHLLMHGFADEALRIVRACRARYDGSRRNPFDEYECGHWYARALASYSLLQAASGVRYDAVDRRLSIDPTLSGDVVTFIATATGYGLAGLRGGAPYLEVYSGEIEVRELVVRGQAVETSRLTGSRPA